MKFRQVAVMLVAVLALAACAANGEDTAGGDTSDSEPPTVEAESAVGGESDQTSAGGSETIAVESSDLGDILVDDEGLTLYVFDNDADENSTCYDDCEANWPPVIGEATAGDGVDQSLLGTSQRENGDIQVTYGGKPLYYFAGDQAPGDTNGQAVGDVWWVVGPDGEAITGDGVAASGNDDTDDGY